MQNRSSARTKPGEPAISAACVSLPAKNAKLSLIDVDDIDHDATFLRWAPNQLLNPAGMNAGSFSSMNCFTSGELNTWMNAFRRGSSFLSGRGRELQHQRLRRPCDR